MNTDNETLPRTFSYWAFLAPRSFSSLFSCFLIMYILTVGGNMAILILVSTSHQLHTPMYFFLSNLSFLEIWYTTAAVPKALAILLGRSQSISFTSCLLQMYLVFSLGCWSTSSWQPWLMTITFGPSAILYTMGLSWTAFSQCSWLWAPGSWFPGHCSSHSPHQQPDLLWAPHYQPLLLWHCTLDCSGLYQHTAQWGFIALWLLLWSS